MKTFLAFFVCFAFLTSVFMVNAQDNSHPASTNIRGAEFPRVYPDYRVAFQFKAPDAKKVQLMPGFGTVARTGYNGLGKAAYDMVRGEDLSLIHI